MTDPELISWLDELRPPRDSAYGRWLRRHVCPGASAPKLLDLRHLIDFRHLIDDGMTGHDPGDEHVDAGPGAPTGATP